MPSAWVEHVKDFASKKEMKYSEAMKNDECKELYHRSKETIDKKKVDEITRPKVKIDMKAIKEVKKEPMVNVEVKMEAEVKKKRTTKKTTE